MSITSERAESVSRDELSRRAFNVLSKTGVNLNESAIKGVTLHEMQIIEGHDVHGYYSLGGGGIPERIGGAAVGEVVLHVQVYPGMSTNKLMCFMGRYMDKERLIADRVVLGNRSLGNERAVIGQLYEGRRWNDPLEWSDQKLIDLIREGLALKV